MTAKKAANFKAILQRDSTTKAVMPLCHFTGGNYWILKTTYQNRGIGIHVFKSLSELNKILSNYIQSDKTLGPVERHFEHLNKLVSTTQPNFFQMTPETQGFKTTSFIGQQSNGSILHTPV